MTLYDELKARGLIAQVTNEPEISKMINEGKAVFYIGIDPTADSLTAGHFMVLSFMKRLQMGGNKPIVLVGGGTGMIGDPGDRTEMRKIMSLETIEHNCDCIKKQLMNFIDFGDDKAIMLNNADWLRELNYVELLRDVGVHFTINRMLAAECYKSRMEKGLTFLELNYMIMQAYDFAELYRRYGCILQFGGDDQWSNMLAGTELIRRKYGKDAHVLTIKLLENSDGEKMGKTAKGAVWLDAERTTPFEFYQYWRNVADADVVNYLKMLTFLPLEQISELEKQVRDEPNAVKEILAFELTATVHGKETAQQVRETARELFKSGAAADMPTLQLTQADFTDGSIDILTLLVKSGLCQSKSDARRNVEQGGVSASGEQVASIETCFTIDDCAGEGLVLKRGKKNYRKVVLN